MRSRSSREMAVPSTGFVVAGERLAWRGGLGRAFAQFGDAARLRRLLLLGLRRHRPPGGIAVLHIGVIAPGIVAIIPVLGGRRRRLLDGWRRRIIGRRIAVAIVVPIAVAIGRIGRVVG